MRVIANLPEAGQAVRDWLAFRPEATPPIVRERMRLWDGLSPVGLAELARTIFDVGEAAGPELMQLGAGLLGLVAVNGWFDCGQDGSARAMRLALLRDAGEPAQVGMPWPDPADDPARRAAEG